MKENNNSEGKTDNLDHPGLRNIKICSMTKNVSHLHKNQLYQTSQILPIYLVLILYHLLPQNPENLKYMIMILKTVIKFISHCPRVG